MAQMRQMTQMTQMAQMARTGHLRARAFLPFPAHERCHSGRPTWRASVAMSTDARRDPDTYAIIGAAMEVHRHLGFGFLEAVYVEALHRELHQRGIPFAREVALCLRYKDHWLTTSYRADLVCYDTIIVELKARREVGGPEDAQVLNYLKASGLSRGLLLNFGTPRLEYRRYVWSHRSPTPGSADGGDDIPR